MPKSSVTDELERNWKALKKGYEAARDAHMEVEFIMTFGLAMAAGDDVREAVRHRAESGICDTIYASVLGRQN